MSSRSRSCRTYVPLAVPECVGPVWCLQQAPTFSCSPCFFGTHSACWSCMKGRKGNSLTNRLAGAVQVQIWDADRVKQVRQLRGHSARVSALAWNRSTLSSGGRDTSILNHDVRCAAERMMLHVQTVVAMCNEAFPPVIVVWILFETLQNSALNRCTPARNCCVTAARCCMATV
jgi:WD40 repeat protein